MRTLVVGDIHGAHRALVQVLERAGFEAKADRLISLGDVADGMPDTAECVETLLAIPNLVAVRGNHDIWAQEFLEFQVAHTLWIKQGGQATLDSYKRTGLIKDPRHLAFFRDQVPYYLDAENRLYLHANFDYDLPLDQQSEYDLAWGRSFWQEMAACAEDNIPFPEFEFRTIFLGHTPTPIFTDHHDPVHFGNVWNLDQGAKIGGKLTLMDAETKQYWQSDLVSTLY